MTLTLDSILRSDVAAVLHQTTGLPLHVRRERLYRWALDHGENMSLVEDLLYRENEFSEVVKEYVASQARALEEKRKADKAWEEKCRKEKRWDEAHNCEIPIPNTDDPKERRFRHNAGSDTSRDVTWDSHTPTPSSSPPTPAPAVPSASPAP